MPINEQRARYHLKSGDVQKLFIDELGWNHLDTTYSVTVANQSFTLSPLAERNGIAALRCEPNSDGAIPEYATRRKIEQAVTKQVAEHIIVYLDTNGDRQIWQWVRREPGKPSAYREEPFHAATQSGDILVHKLRHIAYDLAEEESSTLTGAAAKLRKAFDVEKVTKKFFDLFKKQHSDFLKQIEGIGSEDDKAWYASVMLNRLMFVRFIQQKRFLADDPDYLRNRLNMVREQAGPGRFHDFYRLFLLRLFHEGLGEKPGDRTKEKNAELLHLLGSVPYLNGGIFSKHGLEETYADAIRIPDSAFDAIFTFFDGFDWLLDNRPLKSEKEINPDVLGYIFEKYINQKEMGAYYTKEDITEYIGRNTIVPYLFDAAKEKCPRAFEPFGIWRLAQADPDRYIFPAMKHGMELTLPADIAAGIKSIPLRGGWNKPAEPQFALPTEIWREVVARRARCKEVRLKLSSGEVQSINDFITLNLNIRQFAQDVIESCEDPELLQAIWKSVETVRVLDPTVGSGAFLFAALNILEPLYEACLDRMEAFVGDTERAQSTWAGEMAFVNEVSAQQAFIEEGATEYAEHFKQILTQIADHRDRRYHIYKSIIVNNLFGVDIMEEATEICKLRLFLKLVAQIDRVEDLEPLPDIDFNIRAGNTLVGYASIEDIDRLWHAAEFADTRKSGSMSFERDNERLRTMANEYAHLLKDFRKQQLGEHASDTVTKEQVARAANDVLRPELDKDLWRLYRKSGKLADKTTLAQFLSSHSPLHWFVEFPEVMTAGGFDVVVGNPPYVQRSEITSYSTIGYSTGQCPDIYANVVERSTGLANHGGRTGMIVPLSVTFSGQFKSLRSVLAEQRSNWFSSYDNIPAAVFYGVSQRCTIWMGTTSKGEPHEAQVAPMRRWRAEYRPFLVEMTEYTTCLSGDFNSAQIPKYGHPSQARVFNSIRTSTTTVSNALHGASHAKLGYSKSARNYVTCFLEEPPCLDEHTLRAEPSGKIGWIQLTNAEDASRCLALTSGSLYFWYWLVCGDGFDVTNWMIEDFIMHFTGRISNELELIGLLGKLLHERRLEALQFKKNAGKYVGSFNYAALPAITRRSDLLACAYLGVARDDALALFDYVGRVLSINVSAGEKAIPPSLKSAYAAYANTRNGADQVYSIVDSCLREHYGFTDEELDFIINQDIKYRMGKDTEGDT